MREVTGRLLGLQFPTSQDHLVLVESAQGAGGRGTAASQAQRHQLGQAKLLPAPSRVKMVAKGLTSPTPKSYRCPIMSK